MVLGFFTIKKKDDGGKNIIAYVYVFNEETIGGIGNLPSWTPGSFNIADKGELADEGILDEGVKE